MKKKKGLLIVISGPSGVGKSTIRAEAIKDESLNLCYSVSMTTRAMREGEQEGVDYFFVTKRKFLNAIKRGDFLEWAEYVGNYYGTPKKYVDKLRKQGKSVVLEIETNGAQQVMELEPDCVSVFILPPSMEELERRIRGRKTDSEEVIQERLARAKGEIEISGKYKYAIVNDIIERCADELKDIIRKEQEKA
jgi:guanylate kinase